MAGTTMRLIEHNPKGIIGRVELLRKMMFESIRDPLMRQVALAATHGCPWRDGLCELEAIWYFMHKNIRYTGDAYGIDTYQSARRTVQFRGGDCDDGFTLISTLAHLNGFPAKGRITKNPGGNSWAHIYPLVGMPKVNPTRWIPMDWTLGASRFGAHPPQSGFLEFDGHNVRYAPNEVTLNDYANW